MSNNTKKFSNDINTRCYNFSLSIISLVNRLPRTRSAYIISDQLVRSATSIGANLSEAKSASSRLEYKKFYEISLKSANEVKYWLNLLKDTNMVHKNKVDYLLTEVTEIANMLASGVLKLKGKK